MQLQPCFYANHHRTSTLAKEENRRPRLTAATAERLHHSGATTRRSLQMPSPLVSPALIHWSSMLPALCHPAPCVAGTRRV
ncbi:hypothetical protein N7523_008284 [Penicillium sp. IBT 18751x]|nr:hypothetical protein N7523_008284 [Penicillium sp. IBT 18751x]